MNHSQKFIMKQSIEIIIEFREILSTIWTNYNFLVWLLNKSFACFVGTELLGFIKHIPVLVKVLKEHFVATPLLVYLHRGLSLWKKITPFLLISKIKDDANYKKRMLVFKKDLKNFYENGIFTFLTQSSINPGDDESFCMHCLRFYL